MRELILLSEIFHQCLEYDLLERVLEASKLEHQNWPHSSSIGTKHGGIISFLMRWQAWGIPSRVQQVQVL